MILTQTAVLLLVVRGRLAPIELDAVWPGPGRDLLTDSGPWVIAIIATLAVVAAAFFARCGSRRDLAVAVFWPAAPLAAAWLLLPMAGRPPFWSVLWILPLAGVGLWLRMHAPPRAAALRPRGWLDGRGWQAVHVVTIVLGVAAATLTGANVELTTVLTSLVLYPVYAGIQLTFVLAIPWPRLMVITGGRRPLTIAVIAMSFLLVHWPNPLVMVLTAVGMAYWGFEYGRGRPIGAIALSMGILATLAAQGLSDTWTHHMNVGPGNARERSIHTITAAVLDTLERDPSREHEAIALIASLYPECIGRPLRDAEAGHWRNLIEFERRCVLAALFVSSDERVRRGGEEAPPAWFRETYWDQWPPPWPQTIRDHARGLTQANVQTSWRNDVQTCYPAFLSRPAGNGELAAWNADLTRRQYERLTALLLIHRHDLADASFDTLTSAQMRFSY